MIHQNTLAPVRAKAFLHRRDKPRLLNSMPNYLNNLSIPFIRLYSMRPSSFPEQGEARMNNISSCRIRKQIFRGDSMDLTAFPLCMLDIRVYHIRQSRHECDSLVNTKEIPRAYSNTLRISSTHLPHNQPYINKNKESIPCTLQQQHHHNLESLLIQQP
jgi:hypothetical protein